MRVAVLDLYHQTPNQGMKGITKILQDFKGPDGETQIEFQIFDVRSKNQVPGLGFDAYISSGGPGNPHYKNEEGGSTWGPLWNYWIDSVIEHNRAQDLPKKSVFLICHSFQMMCIHLNVAMVELRKSPSFGIFPMHKTPHGEKEDLFSGLLDPFYALESRKYQVLDPNHEVMDTMKSKILAYEKIRPHVPYDRAIMAIRFTDEIMGTQFHPEADPEILKAFFQSPEKKEELILAHGEKKYEEILVSLDHPEKIHRTYLSLLPQFLKRALELSTSVLTV